MSKTRGPIDLDLVRNAHAKFLRSNSNLIKIETHRAGEFGLTHVSQHPEFKPRTRQLQRKTEYKIVKLKSGAKITLLNKAPYAKAIDQGSPKHMIAAKRARALRFMWKGCLIFRRYVIHPGNKPYKFLYRATVAAGRVFEQSMRHGMEQIGKSF